LKQIIAPVRSNEEVMPGIHLLWVEAPQIVSHSQPGQFVMVRTSDNHDPLLRRPLSIHRVGGNGSLALLFNIVGRGTNWLAQCKAGEGIDLFGPLGRSFEVHSQNLLLVAGGIGIAPLVFLAEKAVADGRHVTLLSGAKTADGIYPGHLLPPDITYVTITEDGSLSKRGPVTDLLAELAEFSQKDEQFFACGPNCMYKTMSALHRLKGKSIQVSTEARMGCGFGGCAGCTIQTKRGLKMVCKDGPIFELSDLIW
jgi:dihydroorotate dehydrogenase electron transfer subunit